MARRIGGIWYAANVGLFDGGGGDGWVGCYDILLLDENRSENCCLPMTIRTHDSQPGGADEGDLNGYDFPFHQKWSEALPTSASF